jgi:hypothetical protein
MNYNKVKNIEIDTHQVNRIRIDLHDPMKTMFLEGFKMIVDRPRAAGGFGVQNENISHGQSRYTMPK